MGAHKDLTNGKPFEVLVKFTLPMLLSAVFQQLYSIADSMIAGVYAGEDALAAIGASYPITMLLMSVCLGSNIGCSVVNARLFGAGDRRGFCTSVNSGFVTALVLSAVLSVAGRMSSRPMLCLLDTPDNIIADSAAYLDIYIYGFVFLFLYNVANGVFTSMGDSKTPLYLLIGSSVANIVLDIVFVKNLGMGVVGAAWATFIAQGAAGIASTVMLYIRIVRGFGEDFVKAERFSMDAVKSLMRLAIPSILQQMFISVGNLFIQALVNGYSSSVVAGYTAAIKLNTFAVVSCSTVGNAISTFTGQNIGARKYKRIHSGYITALVLAMSLVCVFFILYFFMPETFISLFMNTSSSPKAAETGVEFLRIVSPFYFFLAVKLVSDGVLRGEGHIRSFMVSTFADLLLRVVLAFILTGSLGSRGIWISWPIGWIMAMVLSVFLYRDAKRHLGENWHQGG